MKIKHLNGAYFRAISDNCVKYGYSKNYIYKFNNADSMGIYGYSISNGYL